MERPLEHTDHCFTVANIKRCRSCKLEYQRAKKHKHRNKLRNMKIQTRSVSSDKESKYAHIICQQCKGKKIRDLCTKCFKLYERTRKINANQKKKENSIINSAISKDTCQVIQRGSVSISEDKKRNNLKCMCQVMQSGAANYSQVKEQCNLKCKCQVRQSGNDNTSQPQKLDNLKSNSQVNDSKNIKLKKQPPAYVMKGQERLKNININALENVVLEDKYSQKTVSNNISLYKSNISSSPIKDQQVIAGLILKMTEEGQKGILRRIMPNIMVNKVIIKLKCVDKCMIIT